MRALRAPRWVTAQRGQRATYSRLVVVGCGLIGGSIAAAARARWPRLPIIGVDRPPVLADALAQGVITDGHSAAQWLDTLPLQIGDVVVLALPLPLLEATVTAAAERYATASDGPLWLDVGSVKAPIVAHAEAQGLLRFVGGHPMAGASTHGLAAHSSTLLRHRPFVLCPSRCSARGDLERAMRFVIGLGARPCCLSGERHDELVALTSHLPHLVAQALMEIANATKQPGEIWELAAGSWRDATRVAKSDPALWASVFEQNRVHIAHAARGLVAALQRAIARLGAPGDAHRPIAGSGQIAALRRELDRWLPPDDD